MTKLIFLLSGFFVFTVQVFAADLESGFIDPPRAAQPKVLWMWMNGNVTREGITHDLEAMKRVGVGGVLIFEDACGIPSGPVIAGSDLWKEHMAFAAQEADRLGLTIGLHNAPGWSGSGGPWITPKDSMQVLTWSETRINGGESIDVTLQKPFCRYDWYCDIAVFAFQSSADDIEPEGFQAITGSGINADVVTDGDFDTMVSLGIPSKESPAVLTLSSDQPFTARSLTIAARPWQSISGELQVSDDGKTFQKVCDVNIPHHAVVQYPYCCNFSPATARYFRLSVNSKDGVGDANVEIAEFRLHGGNRIENFYEKTGAVARSDGADFKISDEVAVNPSSIVDLTEKMDAGGRLHWGAPAGDWIVVRMGHTTTGVTGREAPDGADGLQCDKLSKKALEVHWNAMFKPLLESVKEKGAHLDYIEVDSWEVGSQNWTPGFTQEFCSRRGYDLSAYWPVLTGRIVGNQKETNRFLRDFRRTIADLIADNYFGHLHELANRQGLKLYAEAYGNGIFDWLECAGRADVPMTEFWVNEEPEVGFHEKFAASPAHIYGRPIVAAEAFTSTAGKDFGRWLDVPGSMKAVADNKAFCGGINMLVFHRFAHNPWPDLKPGMTMGPYGTHFDGTLTWWEQGRAWLEYLARCQHLLQQGRVVADVCYFRDAEYGALPARQNLKPCTPDGYDYDGCSADALMMMSVKNGKIILPSGMSYRYLILNDSWQMSLEAVEKIRELVADGATVIGGRPWLSPGLKDWPNCDQEICKIAAEVWGNCNGKSVKQNRFGNGRVIHGMTLEEIMDADGLLPDFSYETESGKRLNYIHRRTDDAEIYFVSTPEKESLTAQCAFRVTGKIPMLWHPDSGRIERAAVWREENGRTVVDLSFDPIGSVFVVFQTLETLGDRFPKEIRFKNVFEPVEVTGPWTVQFDPQWTKPPVGKKGRVVFDQLDDWSKRPEEGVRYYSGTAVYQNKVSIPEQWLKEDRKIVLDLGRVEVLAEVFLNGESAGILWKQPFQADVTKLVKPGANKLEVKVVNLWPNRLIGDEQLPDDCERTGGAIKTWPSWLKGSRRSRERLTFTTLKHWGKNDALLPSGLLGPVTLRASEPVEWEKNADSKGE